MDDCPHNDASTDSAGVLWCEDCGANLEAEIRKGCEGDGWV